MSTNAIVMGVAMGCLSVSASTRLASHDVDQDEPSTCDLCFNDQSIAEEEIIRLTCCNNQACRVCTRKWFEIQEASGREESSCPYCRSCVKDEAVFAVLGRSFQKRETKLERYEDETIDELTLQWLEENTKQCPCCGSHVERTDGCNHMTCVCGCEFCYSCGNISCSCEEGYGTFTQQDEAIRDNQGVVNLRACIQRHNGFDIRQDRRDQDWHVEREFSERWTHEEGLVHNSDGRWLFETKGKESSINILFQLDGQISVRDRRVYERNETDRIPFTNPWLFNYEDVELSVFILHKTLCVDMNCETCHVRRERYYKNYRLISEAGSRWRPCGKCSTSVRYKELLHTSDGRWLFETKGRVSSINILFQGGVQKDRLSKRLENNTLPYTNPSWLLDEDLELGLLNLHRALCNDLNCEICNGTEEERELQNQENMILLFG